MSYGLGSCGGVEFLILYMGSDDVLTRQACAAARSRSRHAPMDSFQKLDVLLNLIWVVVKIMVPFWVPIIIRPLIFKLPKKGP